MCFIYTILLYIVAGKYLILALDVADMIMFTNDIQFMEEIKTSVMSTLLKNDLGLALIFFFWKRNARD